MPYSIAETVTPFQFSLIMYVGFVQPVMLEMFFAKDSIIHDKTVNFHRWIYCVYKFI